MTAIGIKTARNCAFCRYWYDPANSAIRPRAPQINVWEYDDKVKCKCLKKNYDTNASASCMQYELKLEIMGKV